MRIISLSLALLPALSGWCQNNHVPEFFRRDPFTSNGFFILDQRATTNLGIDHVYVEIIATDHHANPSPPAVVHSFTLNPTQPWAGAQLDALGPPVANTTYHYRVRGYATDNSVVYDKEPQQFNGDPSYATCNQVCIGDGYAWLLTNYSNITETAQTIYLTDAP